MFRTLPSLIVLAWAALAWTPAAQAEIRAGAAKVDITDLDAGPVNDPLYVKALVLENGSTKAVIITIDADDQHLISGRHARVVTHKVPPLASRNPHAPLHLRDKFVRHPIKKSR